MCKAHKIKNVLSKRLSLLVLFALLIHFTSCATVPSENPADPKTSVSGTNVPYGEERKMFYLQPGDVIDIKFYYNPDLNETVTIRPDGKISLQLIGEIDAADKTPSIVNEVIIEKYKKFLKKPEVVVIVKGFGGHKVYVGGEVMSPGVMPCDGTTTALQAILTAGGFRETAQPRSVILISKGPENKPVFRKLDLKADVLLGKAMGRDVLLKPFDILYVPKTAIAKLNKFVEQYITKMIPGTLSAGFAYTRYEGKQEGTITTIPP